MTQAQQKTPLDFDSEIAHFTPRQMEVCAALDRGYKFILYGGALGGGKSYLLRWIAVRILFRIFARYGLTNTPVMLACEDYPTLKDRQISKILKEYPEWLGRYHDDHKAYGKSFILSPEYGSGIICLRNLDDPSKYQSAEFAAILVDELTKNPVDTFTDLRMRLRWPGVPDQECPFIGGTNPGGVGHNYCKAYWIDKVYPPEFIRPIDYRGMFKYIPSKADDNPYIDPSYWQILNTLPENIRQAFRDGSWDIFRGQAFTFLREYHVTKPLPIPENAQLYSTFDWGFGAPFSWGWWWVDNDGRGYRFAEIYGWNGTPNQGVRWEDSRIAQEVRRREAELSQRYGISFARCIRKAGPDCFQKKPDYKGGGQGPSTAEVFAKEGIFLASGDARRDLKLRQFRERLQIPRDAEGKQNGLPMLMVYDECDQFIRTIPNISTHPTNVEEIDEKGEDHAFDEACHFCMARPIALAPSVQPVTLGDLRIQYIERPDPAAYETYAQHEGEVDRRFWDTVGPGGLPRPQEPPVVELTRWSPAGRQQRQAGKPYSDVDGR